MNQEEELFQHHVNLLLITLLAEDPRFLQKEPTLKTNSKISGAERTRELLNSQPHQTSLVLADVLVIVHLHD